MLQKVISILPLTRIVAAILLFSAIVTYDAWKACNAYLAVLVGVSQIFEDVTVHGIFLCVSSGWCILHHDMPRQLRRKFMGVLALLFVCFTLHYFAVPFFFTFLVVTYCTIITIEFHCVVENTRELKGGIRHQIASNERDPNDVTAALIMQMENQYYLLNDVQKMMILYLLGHVVNSSVSVYLFSPPDNMAATMVGHILLHTVVFGFLVKRFSECHVDAFPYAPFTQLPIARSDSSAPELTMSQLGVTVWTYHTKQPDRDIELLQQGELAIGLFSHYGGEPGGPNANDETIPFVIICNPSFTDLEERDRANALALAHGDGREREGGVTINTQ